MLRHASGCLRSTSPLSSRDIPGMNGEVSLENRLIDTKYHRKLDFHARWCACGAWLTADAPVVVIVRAGLLPISIPISVSVSVSRCWGRRHAITRWRCSHRRRCHRLQLHSWEIARIDRHNRNALEITRECPTPLGKTNSNGFWIYPWLVRQKRPCL